MLEVKDLGFDYDDTCIFHKVSFSVKKGELLHVIGSNGSGKTTLLKILATLLTPHTGSVFWEKKNLRDTIQQYKQQIAYVGHKLALSPQLTIKENCLLDIQYKGNAASFELIIKAFHLTHQANMPVYQLSFGQKKRASLLRLHLNLTSLWLLDEPFIGLDKSAAKLLAQSIEYHLKNGGIVIMTSHESLQEFFPNRQEYHL